MSNSKLSKTKTLKKEILSKIEEHLSNDILLNDIEKFLNELNWWKISTLNENLDSFLWYIDDILSGFDDNIDTDDNLSKKDIPLWEKTQKEDFFSALSIIDESYIQKVNQVRWFFWLTVTEFTQWRNSNLVLKYRKIVEK